MTQGAIDHINGEGSAKTNDVSPFSGANANKWKSDI